MFQNILSLICVNRVLNLCLGKERLNNMQKQLCDHKLQLLRLQLKENLLKCEFIKEEVCDLKDNDKLEGELQKIEKKFYKRQLQIFDIKMDIIDNSEKLLRFHLKEFLSSESQGKTANTINDLESKTVEVNSNEEEQHSFENKKGEVSGEDEEEDVFYDCEEDEKKIDDEKPDCYDKESALSMKGSELDPVKDNKKMEPLSLNENDNCILPQNSDVITNFLLEGSTETNNEETNICSRDIRQPHLHKTEEWEKKQSIIKSINRLYRKRAWLRLKKVSHNCDTYVEFDVHKALSSTDMFLTVS